MKQTIVVYGSTTGTCEAIAQNIANKLGVKAINVSELTADVIAAHDNLLLGTSTWGSGEVQDDWYSGMEVIGKASLAGKTVALFGCGDSVSYADTFCGGMATICKAVCDGGANVIGAVSTDGYTFDASEAVVDGKFVGLALDQDNEGDLTEGRIETWLNEIKKSL